MASAFFQRIEALCLDKGVSSTKLAKDIGLSESTISGWRVGANPRNNTLAQLANYFGVSPAYLAGKVDDPIDYASIDTSGFNQPVFQKLLKDNGYNDRVAIKAYLDYEKTLAHEAIAEGNPVFQSNAPNNGFIGQANAPVRIINGTEHTLSDQESEILRIFSELSTLDRSKVLIYAAELKDKK